MPATEMAQAIAAGKHRSREIVDALIHRLEDKQPQHRAIAVPLYEQARLAADAADRMMAAGEPVGPLHGVPITVKESIDVKGTPSTWGLTHRIGDLAAASDPAVQRLENAGAIILGKTNIMQLLMSFECDNPVYGRSTNPWDEARTPGGSSGGEGAAIAIGGSPLGLGTDIGGSVRIPAQFSGIHSLKPTPGRIRTMPPRGIFHVGSAAGAMYSPGPMARSVDDLSLAMRVMADGQDRQSIEPERITPGALRIGYYTTDGILPPAPAIVRLVRQAVEAMRLAGAQVKELPLAATALPEESAAGFYRMLCTDGGQGMRRTLQDSPTMPQLDKLLSSQGMSRFKRALLCRMLSWAGYRSMAELALPHVGAKSTAAIEQAVNLRAKHRASFLQLLDQHGIDVLICPAFVTTAPPHGSSLKLSFEGTYASLYNYLQLPAGVVSLSRVQEGAAGDATRLPTADKLTRTLQQLEQGSAGLPVGVQVAGRPYREDQVLAVMKALETAFSGRPDYPSGMLCR